MREIGRNTVLGKIARALSEVAAGAGDEIVIALSGGLDSVALLHALRELRSRFGYQLTAAHLNHHLRGEESDRDETFVRRLCAKSGIDLAVEHLRGLQPNSANLEERARKVRHAFLNRVAEDRGARFVALAHHADDQAETVLLRLLRGSGLSGLKAMAPAGPGKLVRPMLKCRKTELYDYLITAGGDWVEDSSNHLTAILRNRVRHGLIPGLERDYAPGLSEHLAALADELREVDEVISPMVAQGLGQTLRADGALNLEAFVELKPAIASRVMRAYVELRAGTLRGIEHVHVASLLRLCREGPPNGALDLPGRLRAERRYSEMMIVKADVRISAEPFAVTLRVPGETIIDTAAMVVEVKESDVSEVRVPATKFEALFDAEQVKQAGASLSARQFVQGDRIHPLGMSGSRKLKDVFIDAKIPRAERARFPVVVLGRNVTWVPGLVRGREAILTARSERVLRITAKSIVAP